MPLADRADAQTPVPSAAAPLSAQTTAAVSSSPSRAWRWPILRFCRYQFVRVWAHLPNCIRQTRLGEELGRLIHYLVRELSDRQQYFATYFLRNRPELQLMCRLIAARPLGSAVRIAVLACSKGAEVYSIAWAIRTARPDLELHIEAVDISRDIVEFAERGIYSCATGEWNHHERHRSPSGSDAVARNTDLDQGSSIFERIEPAEFEQMFELTGVEASVRPWLRRGISWSAGDACDPGLAQRIGSHDIVVANRFLCHMPPALAERCLRNIATLVKPQGYLFVSGVDLNVRTKVAHSMGWNPVLDLIHEIHDGDCSIRQGWPLNYWALEPLRPGQRNWHLRYASAFQIGRDQDI